MRGNPEPLADRLRLAASACEDALADVYGHDQLVLRLATAAQLMDTPVESVRGWLKRGLLPAVKIGRSVYITRADLEVFVEKHRA